MTNLNSIWETAAKLIAILGYTPENVANKDTDISLTANSDTKYPSQKAVKTYADSKVADAINDGEIAKAPSQNAVFDALALKAPLASPIFTGTVDLGEGVILGYQTVVGSGGTTVLTTSSPIFTRITTAAQTIQMPVATTLQAGQQFWVTASINNSNNILTSGGNSLGIIRPSGCLGIFTCVDPNGGTGTASWSSVIIPSSVSTATAFANAQRDGNANLTCNNYIPGFATTATAGGTTTLTAASAAVQDFTGSTTQTCVMPVVSTLSTGISWQINNYSSGNVTVQSSGGNTIATLSANQSLTLWCKSTSGTGTSSWGWLAPQTLGG